MLHATEWSRHATEWSLGTRCSALLTNHKNTTDRKGVAALPTARCYRIVWQDRCGLESSWLIDELKWARSIAGALASRWKKTVYVVTVDTNEIVYQAAPIPEVVHWAA